MTIQLIFQIGCARMCEMWVSPDQVPEAMRLILGLYEPFAVHQNYCFTLYNKPEREV